MTAKDFKLIAEAFAEVEEIVESTDVDGIGSSSLRLAVDSVAGKIKSKHPRFNTGKFYKASLPRQSERQKQAILKTLNM